MKGCGLGEFNTIMKLHGAPGVIPAPRCFIACELFSSPPQSSCPTEERIQPETVKFFPSFPNSRLETIILVKLFFDLSSDPNSNGSLAQLRDNSYY